MVGLVGANGAGKTTTLLAAAGVLRPDAGTVLIGGIDLATRPVEAKRMLGFVPDEPALFDYLSVEEHLRFIGTALRRGRHRTAPPCPPGRPGTGRPAEVDCQMSCRGGCGRSWRSGVRSSTIPKVLLLDEPLTGLDPVGIRRMKDAIRQKASEGAAVLLSSHLLARGERTVLAGDRAGPWEGARGGIAEPRSRRAGPTLGGSLEDAVLDLLTE